MLRGVTDPVQLVQLIPEGLARRRFPLLRLDRCEADDDDLVDLTLGVAAAGAEQEQEEEAGDTRSTQTAATTVSSNSSGSNSRYHEHHHHLKHRHVRKRSPAARSSASSYSASNNNNNNSSSSSPGWKMRLLETRFAAQLSCNSKAARGSGSRARTESLLDAYDTIHTALTTVPKDARADMLQSLAHFWRVDKEVQTTAHRAFKQELGHERYVCMRLACRVDTTRQHHRQQQQPPPPQSHTGRTWIGDNDKVLVTSENGIDISDNDNSNNEKKTRTTMHQRRATASEDSLMSDSEGIPAVVHSDCFAPGRHGCFTLSLPGSDETPNASCCDATTGGHSVDIHFPSASSIINIDIKSGRNGTTTTTGSKEDATSKGLPRQTGAATAAAAAAAVTGNEQSNNNNNCNRTDPLAAQEQRVVERLEQELVRLQALLEASTIRSVANNNTNCDDTRHGSFLDSLPHSALAETKQQKQQQRTHKLEGSSESFLEFSTSAGSAQVNVKPSSSSASPPDSLSSTLVLHASNNGTASAIGSNSNLSANLSANNSDNHHHDNNHPNFVATKQTGENDDDDDYDDYENQQQQNLKRERSHSVVFSEADMEEKNRCEGNGGAAAAVASGDLAPMEFVLVESFYCESSTGSGGTAIYKSSLPATVFPEQQQQQQRSGGARQLTLSSSSSSSVLSYCLPPGVAAFAISMSGSELPRVVPPSHAAAPVAGTAEGDDVPA